MLGLGFRGLGEEDSWARFEKLSCLAQAQENLDFPLPQRDVCDPNIVHIYQLSY